MKRLLLASCVVSLAGGCASTNPGSGVSIQYSLPNTSVAASLTMILNGCPDRAGKGLLLDSNLTVVASAGVGDELYQINGRDLASVRTKRNITIHVDDRGVLAGLNSSIEDRTAAIVSDTISIATKLTLLAAPPDTISTRDPGARLQCRPEIVSALARVESLRLQVQNKRQQMANSSDPVRRSSIREDIDALAFEIARLRTGELAQTLTATLDLGNEAPSGRQNIGFNYDGLRTNWFVEPMDQQPAPGPNLPAPNPISRPLTDSELSHVFGVSWGAQQSEVLPGIIGRSSRRLASCRLSMYVPAQNQATLDISPYGSAIGSSSTARVSVPIAQWGVPEEICLGARFGDNRTVNVSFTPFGQRKSLSWASAASAEAITSAISGIVDDVDGLRDSLDSPSGKENRQETIDRVNQLLQFNAAVLCEEAAEAGATSCPDAN